MKSNAEQLYLYQFVPYSLRKKTVNITHFPSARDEQSSDEDSSSDGASFISEDEYSSEEDDQPSVKGKKN